MKQFKVEGHEPSLLPAGDWKLAWADEFDGTELDMNKWSYRLHMMNKRHPAWVDRGVELDGKSNLVFTLLEENGMPVSAQLQTGFNYMDEPVQVTAYGEDDTVQLPPNSRKDTLQWPIGKLHENHSLHGKGYYECRCRLQQKKGWWSAFWLQSPIIGATNDTKTSGAEIDIMESFRPGVVMGHNVFAGGYGVDNRRIKIGGRQVDPLNFHTFGLLWDDDGYTFYIDGVEDGRVEDDVSGFPEIIMITTEVRGYRRPEKQPEPEAFDSIGDTFLVDYIRVFERK